MSGRFPLNFNNKFEIPIINIMYGYLEYMTNFYYVQFYFPERKHQILSFLYLSTYLSSSFNLIHMNML